MLIDKYMYMQKKKNCENYDRIEVINMYYIYKYDTNSLYE